MPNYPKAQAVRRGIDLAYSKRQIGSAVTSGILQGHSVGQIAAEVQRHVTDMSWTSATRAARTAVTAAQNGGRQDTYEAAQKMGIELKKEWVATLDNRTRHAHAMADGQVVAVDKPFKLDGYDLMFPGDKRAPGYLVYNCRCTTIAAFKDYGKAAQRRSIDGVGEDMTYQEWEKKKEKSGSVFDGVPAEYKDEVIRHYNSAPPEIRKVWEKCADKLHEPKYDAKSGAYFAPADECTHYESIKKAYEASGYQEQNAVFFHEYGHNIDYIIGGGEGQIKDYYSVKYKDRAFGKSIEKECESGYKKYWYASKGDDAVYNTVKMQQNELELGGMGFETYLKYAIKAKMPTAEYREIRTIINNANGDDGILKSVFDKYLRKYEENAIIYADKETAKKFCDYIKTTYDVYERSDVSDIYENFMASKFDIEYPFGIGHGKAYSTQKDYTAVEAFAEMYSATATNNKSLKTIKKMFPESYKIFLDMLKEV